MAHPSTRKLMPSQLAGSLLAACTLCGASNTLTAPLGAGGFCPACYLHATGGAGWHQAAVGQGVALTRGLGAGPACQMCGAPAVGQIPGGQHVCGNCAHMLFKTTGAVTLAAAAPLQGRTPAAESLPRDDLRLVDLIGWRIWRVTASGYLRSLTVDVIWLPGEPMEAAEVTDHGAASNGIHVFMERVAALKEMTTYLDLRGPPIGSNFALGSVLLWGEVVEHERGYRAERAKILSIDDVVWDGKPPWDGETKKALAFLRERYGVAG